MFWIIFFSLLGLLSIYWLYRTNKEWKEQNDKMEANLIYLAKELKKETKNEL